LLLVWLATAACPWCCFSKVILGPAISIDIASAAIMILIIVAYFANSFYPILLNSGRSERGNSGCRQVSQTVSLVIFFIIMRFVIVASDLFDSDEEIEQKYDDGISKRSISNLGDELTVDAIRNIEGLTRTINNILANRKIIKENYDVVKVELKPLDIFSYCKNAFEKCSKI